MYYLILKKSVKQKSLLFCDEISIGSHVIFYFHIKLMIKLNYVSIWMGYKRLRKLV